MKIFSADRIRDWDAFTIKEENISSEALMDRAAARCTEWLLTNTEMHACCIFCGKGNNGGDGIAIAKMLLEKGKHVSVFILENEHPGTNDFLSKLKKIKKSGLKVHHISSTFDFPETARYDIVIDALFGTGLSRPLSGLAAALADHINASGRIIVSIDIPSGMMCDNSVKGEKKIKATHTLSFTQKLAFMMAENEMFFGSIHHMDIGLSRSFAETAASEMEIPEADFFRDIIKPRPLFANKGSFGHGVLFAGSKGMMGAAILAARGYLHAGAGKLTCHVPEAGYEIMQTSVPEAMCETSGKDQLDLPEIKIRYDAIAAGPGIGQKSSHGQLLSCLFKLSIPLILDADALNTIATNQHLFSEIPAGTIITPHPGEFDRLFGKAENDFNRLRTATLKAREHKIIIVLKGHHTASCFPDGKIFFNNTGNPGMAKPGMGDVLTGMLLALLAQGYDSKYAALLGVYLHGKAGDLAAEKFSQESMTASDLIRCIPEIWKQLR